MYVSAPIFFQVLHSLSFKAVKRNINVLKDSLNASLFPLFCFLCIFPFDLALSLNMNLGSY